MFPKAPRLMKSHDHCHQIRGNFSKTYSFKNNLVIREPNPKYDNKKSQQVQKLHKSQILKKHPNQRNIGLNSYIMEVIWLHLSVFLPYPNNIALFCKQLYHASKNQRITDLFPCEMMNFGLTTH